MKATTVVSLDQKPGENLVAARVGSSESSKTKKSRPPRDYWVPILLYGVLGIVVVLPMGLVLVSALTKATPGPGGLNLDTLTLSNFAVLFGGGAREAGLNSLVIGAGSAVLSLLFGGLLAFLTARSNAPGRGFLYFVGLAPMFLPTYVGALAWAILGAPNSGLINVLGRDFGSDGLVNIYSLGGLIMVLGLYYSPYAFLLIHASLSLMNPDLEESARVHGAKPLAIFGRVTLPLATPSILGAGILTFVLTIENFPVAQAIGAPGGVETLPTYLYRLMNAAPSRGNEAAAVAIALVLVVLVVTLLQRKIVSKSDYTTVSGKGLRANRFELGVWRYPFMALAMAFFVMSSVLPLLALTVVALHNTPYIGSVTLLFEDPGAHLSLEMFGRVLQDSFVQQAAFNSIIVAVFAALCGTLLAFAVSYVVNRTDLPLKAGLGYISMLPLAVPAIVLGLGLLWTWLILPIPIYGTLAVLVVAFVASNMAQGYQGAGSAILQVHRDLEESAILAGANRLKTVWRITTPLLRVPLTSTFLLLTMLAMRELTVPLFLFTTDTRLLSIMIFDDFENGMTQKSAAVSLVYCALIFVVAAIARRMGAKSAV